MKVMRTADNSLNRGLKTQMPVHLEPCIITLITSQSYYCFQCFGFGDSGRVDIYTGILCFIILKYNITYALQGFFHLIKVQKSSDPEPNPPEPELDLSPVLGSAKSLKNQTEPNFGNPILKYKFSATSKRERC